MDSKDEEAIYFQKPKPCAKYIIIATFLVLVIIVYFLLLMLPDPDPPGPPSLLLDNILKYINAF